MDGDAKTAISGIVNELFCDLEMKYYFIEEKNVHKYCSHQTKSFIRAIFNSLTVMYDVGTVSSLPFDT